MATIDSSGTGGSAQKAWLPTSPSSSAPKATAMTDRRGTHTFVSSGDVETFARLGRRLLGPELDHVVGHRWEAT